EIVIRTRTDSTAPRRDDAGRHRVTQAERITDADDPIADAGVRGGSPLHEWQRLPGLQLQQGEVRLLIGADDLRLQLTLIQKGDRHLVGAFDDMVVCDDIAVGGDYEARPDAHHPPLGCRTRALAFVPEALGELIAEEVLEELPRAV